MKKEKNDTLPCSSFPSEMFLWDQKSGMETASSPFGYSQGGELFHSIEDVEKDITSTISDVSEDDPIILFRLVPVAWYYPSPGFKKEPI